MDGLSFQPDMGQRSVLGRCGDTEQLLQPGGILPGEAGEEKAPAAAASATVHRPNSRCGGEAKAAVNWMLDRGMALTRRYSTPPRRRTCPFPTEYFNRLYFMGQYITKKPRKTTTHNPVVSRNSKGCCPNSKATANAAANAKAAATIRQMVKIRRWG